METTSKTDNRNQPRVLKGLNRGLPNYWYPILRSSQLGKGPISIRRFCQDLAVWRDGSGMPHIFQSHCPHRGAPLALGKVVDNELACSYHGWQFDSQGKCTRMPLEDPTKTQIRKIQITFYKAAERAGYIWMFYGEPANATPLSVPYELEDAGWCTFRTEYVWQTNWLNVMDNIMDPLHAIHLHAGAVTQRKRAKFAKFQITQDSEIGFRLGKLGYLDDGSVGKVESEVEFVYPNVLRLDIAHGIYRAVIVPTPIDENSVCAFYARSRRVRGLKRLMWWIAWSVYYSKPVRRVAAQDGQIMSGIGPIGEARLREHLVSSDIGVIHLRKRLNQAFFGGGE